MKLGDGPFLGSDARKAGVRPALLRTSEYRQVFRGVYAHRVYVDAHLRTRAALALHPPAAFASHHSAARVLHLPVPIEPDEHITVLDPMDRRHRDGIRCHVVTGEPLVVEHAGMRISHPYRLFIEMAGKVGLVDRVVLGDAMARILGVSPPELLGACRESTRHHARKAAAAAELVREGVDSPNETKLRMLLLLAGFPEPEVNYRIYRQDGSVRWRFDLCYPELRLVIEYDGRQHAESDDQWDHDITRREWMDGNDWRLIVVRSKGLFVTQEETLDRVRRAMVERGGHTWDVVIGDAWRRHFRW